MAVLLLYNSRDSMTVQEVMEETSLTKKNCDKVIHSLVKCHLLKPDKPDKYDQSASLGKSCLPHCVSSKSHVGMLAS